MRICIFGDSIAWGACDHDNMGWAAMLRKYLEKKDRDIELYNQSISGDTSKEILSRFDAEAKSRYPDMIIFAIGINDSSIQNSRNMVELIEFEENLLKLIKHAKEFTGKIIFLGLTKVDEDRTNPTPWDNICYLNKEILKYDKQIEKISKDNNLSYIRLFGLLEKSDLSDGLHPNRVGHMKLFRSIEDNLGL